MARTPESSFGSKIAKAQQLLDYIKTLKDYSPPSDYLKPEALAKIIDKANEANKQVVSTNSLLAQARINRNEAYYGDKGLRFRCAMIRDFVGILPTGKTSSAYITIQKEVQKINNYKKSPKKEETASEAGQDAKRSISRAETSFGSVLQSLKNILEVIKNTPLYEPNNEHITIKRYTKANKACILPSKTSKLSLLRIMAKAAESSKK